MVEVAEQTGLARVKPVVLVVVATMSTPQVAQQSQARVTQVATRAGHHITPLIHTQQVVVEVPVELVVHQQAQHLLQVPVASVRFQTFGLQIPTTPVVVVVVSTLVEPVALVEPVVVVQAKAVSRLPLS